MDNFKDKKILIMGLGLNGGGVGAAKFFCGQKAEVLVTDLKTEAQLEESLNQLKGLKIKYTLGRHEEKDFLWADLIIKNPDVPSSSPYLEIAKNNKKEIETDVSLFFKYSGAFIIGVTGTKGKSTTASLIYHILKSHHRNTFLAGNIGISPLELIGEIKKGDYVVLELSSFELDDLHYSPQIAVVTNIMPDHLNRYVNMSEYIESKKTIFMHQTKNDYLVLNKDDSIVRQMAGEAKSKAIFFSVEEKPLVNLENFRLHGEHNLQNLLAALKVAEILEIPGKAIEESLKNFKGVPNRQEFIRETGGVKYFNDTTATMPEAAIAAINTFLKEYPDSRLILICGGMDKGLKYAELARLIKERVDEVIMLPGTASDKIREYLGNYTRILEAPTMQQAVKKSKQVAKKGDVVILTPGATSFNLFKNEFDRGRQFVAAVKNLK